MELEESKERLLELARISEEGAKLHPEDSEMFLTDKEAIETVIAELHAMQNLLDEKNDELEYLQKENERYENKIILSDKEYRRVIDAAQKDCVSKDKIREKIKRLEEEEKAELSEFEKRKRLVLPTDTPYLFASAEYSWKKEVLNNLLKEE